jgi:uncharacterized protein (DUF1697 family)
MASYVALLRAVNVAGHNHVAMPELVGVLTELGFEGGRSLLQTGNLVFRAEERSCPELEQLLEEETARRLALRTDYMVRDAAEWQALVEANPFPSEAKDDPGHLVVMFLKDVPSASAVESLQATSPGRERIQAEGKQLYIVYPDGIGRSKLTNTFIERRLGTRGTGRNWNTVLKIAALLQP